MRSLFVKSTAVGSLGLVGLLGLLGFLAWLSPATAQPSHSGAERLWHACGLEQAQPTAARSYAGATTAPPAPATPTAPAGLIALLSPRMPMALREWPAMQAAAQLAGWRVRWLADPAVPAAEWQQAVASLPPDQQRFYAAGGGIAPQGEHAPQSPCLAAVRQAGLLGKLQNHSPSAWAVLPHTLDAAPLVGVMPQGAWLQALQMRWVNLRTTAATTAKHQLLTEAAPSRLSQENQASQPQKTLQSPEKPDTHCIAPITYLPLDPAAVGAGSDGAAALGTYERISPDGRFVLRSFSGARLGQVSLMELPAAKADEAGPVAIKAYTTPLSNEAFPVQNTWRYLVDVNGEHYRFKDVLQQQTRAKPLFKGGMTGFYAAASELRPQNSGDHTIYIRSLSWPQGGDGGGGGTPGATTEGVGPLSIQTIAVQETHSSGSGSAVGSARIVATTGAQNICSNRQLPDGNIYALPMIAPSGVQFSALPQNPRGSQPSMRVYALNDEPMAKAGEHSCALQHDLGLAPSKAVFGYPPPTTQARPTAASPDAPISPPLVFTDDSSVYFYDPQLGKALRLDETMPQTLASAFPALTRDGRVVYGATWRDCSAVPQQHRAKTAQNALDPSKCAAVSGYVVVDPYQSGAVRAAYAQRHAVNALLSPKTCITRAEVAQTRQAFGAFHQLPPER